jgi:hypothetical protein
VCYPACAAACHCAAAAVIRSRPAEFITTAQAILLLLVLVVQLITLYDNMAIRRLLAASGHAAGLDHAL